MVLVDLNQYASNSRKKLKLSKQDVSEFKTGAIVKIRLTNFVTYSLTEFELSPSLNMIIGPNGSGKSTFVCAVCLGLGGKPEFIGRSKKVDDFIKNGSDESIIETYLKGSETLNFPNCNDELIKITRVITRNKKKSVFYINNEAVSESALQDLISTLNIQLDNLCQFLSQERVEDFAQLKSDKLLEETIRSVDSSLLVYLTELKILQSEELELAREVELQNKKLQDLNSRKASLETSVKAFEKYQKMKKDLEVHSKLLPYVKIKTHKLKLQEFKNDYEGAKNNLKALINERKPFVDEKIATEANLKSKRNAADDIKKVLENAKEELEKSKDVVEATREEFQKLKNKKKYLLGRTDKLIKEIDTTNQMIIDKTNELSTIELPPQSDFDNIESDREKLLREENVIMDKLRTFKYDAVKINNGIETIKRLRTDKERAFNSKDKIIVLEQDKSLQDLKNCVLYVRSKPEMLGKVLEPPIMTVSVTHAQYAPYLASCVDMNTSRAFTMINSEAYETFGNRILQNFVVNIRELSNAELPQKMSSQELKHYGFEGYLSDFVTGDENVIKMLCQVSKINLIPVSRKELTESQLNYLTQSDENGRIPFKQIIHGNRHCRFNRSSYGQRQVFMSEVPIKSTRFYQSSVMSPEDKKRIKNDISTLEKQINEKRNELEVLSLKKKDLDEEKTSISMKFDNLLKKQNFLNKKREKHSILMTTLESLKKKLELLQKESKTDTSRRIKDVEKDIAKVVTDEVEKLTFVFSHLDKIKTFEKILEEAVSKISEAEKIVSQIDSKIGEFEGREEELKSVYEEKRKTIKEMKHTPEYQSWMQTIKSYTSEIKKDLDIYAERYDKENNFNLDYIEDCISKLNSQISTLNNDASAITLLRDINEQVQLLESQLPTQVTKFNAVKKVMADNRIKLEPKLDEMVEKISRKFQQLFNSVGSAGAVHLDKPDLYSEWKIKIMVKFRDNAQLKQLNSHIQSGGERAVSTVLYMIALQEFTTAPFRVVDEINQGMDSRNERIIHKAMVENACAENISQYFLITPKLLTDLYYHEKMRVHCVMAGPWIPNPIERQEYVDFGQTSRYILQEHS